MTRSSIRLALCLMVWWLAGAAVASAQPSARPGRVLTVQVSEAHEREAGIGETSTGLLATLTYTRPGRRHTVGGTAQSRLRWLGGNQIAWDSQAFEGHARVGLTERTGVVASTSAVRASRAGDETSALTSPEAGLTVAASVGLAHQWRRRTGVGLSYRTAYVRRTDLPDSTAHGIGVGLTRATSRTFTWQVGYDTGWAHSRSHAAVLAAQLRLPGHDDTRLTVSLRPATTVSSPSQRTSVLAGVVRLDRRLGRAHRLGLGYQRSASLVERLGPPVVANVVSAHLQFPGGTSLFGEYSRAGSEGARPFTRSSVRVGAAFALGEVRE